ncbi:MAG TPA: outer membrane beta-barrel protein [Thermoanaerobaculia bacterium]|nr:outer membrane beta-barrel protein [Thermoanaerobaculia bacterium]HMF10141.1 outer membrane beta-barrel protein [Thermoanaerobaculia bacterium]
MIRARTAILTLSLLLAASSARAQFRHGTVEISPFGGWMFGGSFPAGSTDLFNQKVDVQDEAIYGGRVGWNFTNLFEFEAFYAHSGTHFVSTRDDVLFAPSGTKLGDLSIDYALGLMTLNFGRNPYVTPFVSFGMGAAHLDPDVCKVRNPPCSNPNAEWRYTTTIGGGVKTFFTRHFGMRFDGRYYGTLLNTDDHDCHDGHCHHGSDWLSNGDLTGGFVFAF